MRVELLKAKAKELAESDVRSDENMFADLGEEVVYPSSHFISKEGVRPLSNATMLNVIGGVYSYNHDTANQFDAIVTIERQEFLKTLLSKLSLRQKTVIVFRYGLLDGIPYSAAEVAELLNVPRHTVYLIEQKALYLMRRAVTGESPWNAYWLIPRDVKGLL